jgi:hypothetical protein
MRGHIANLVSRRFDFFLTKQLVALFAAGAKLRRPGTRNAEEIKNLLLVEAFHSHFLFLRQKSHFFFLSIVFLLIGVKMGHW